MIDPLFVVGVSPRCVNMFTALIAQAPSVWGPDSSAVSRLDSIVAVHPAGRSWISSRLAHADVEPQLTAQITEVITTDLRNRDDLPFDRRDGSGTILCPAFYDAMRIEFLASAFPTSRFLYATQQMPAALTDMRAAWESRHYSAYCPPEWVGLPWSLALIDGWRDLVGRPLDEVLLAQCNGASEAILAGLHGLPSGRWSVLSAKCGLTEAAMILGDLGLQLDNGAQDRLHRIGHPLAQRGDLSAPRPATPRRPGAPARELAAEAAGDPEPAHRPGDQAPHSRFACYYTENVPHLLTELNASLLVSKYEAAGALICLAATGDSLAVINRGHPYPAGIGLGPDEISVACRCEVMTYRDRLHTLPVRPADGHDACFVPFASRFFGDIGVRDVAYCGGSLYLVSSLLSAILRLAADGELSASWCPPFISAIAAEDRCHLNGLAVHNAQVVYASAASATDTARGWRDVKVGGGIIIDVRTGEIVVKSLCLPHSPRMHDGQLWFLDSGNGTLMRMDPGTLTTEVVYQGSGFYRGLALSGKYAFIGTSLARGNAFRGLPVERACATQAGIQIVNIENRSLAGFIHFDGEVSEVFDVQILDSARRPEIAGKDGWLALQPLLHDSGANQLIAGSRSC